MNRKTKAKPPTAKAHAKLQSDFNDLQSDFNDLQRAADLADSALRSERNAAATLKADLDKAREETKRAQGMQNHYSTTINELRAELDTAHTLLDALPDPPARKLPATDQWSSERTIALTGRLAAWLAGRSTR